jgi:hypothetical protein
MGKVGDADEAPLVGYDLAGGFVYRTIRVIVAILWFVDLAVRRAADVKAVASMAPRTDSVRAGCDSLCPQGFDWFLQPHLRGHNTFQILIQRHFPYLPSGKLDEQRFRNHQGFVLCHCSSPLRKRIGF